MGGSCWWRRCWIMWIAVGFFGLRFVGERCHVSLCNLLHTRESRGAGSPCGWSFWWVLTGVCLLAASQIASTSTGFWDPVGFMKVGDAAAFKRRRETEIKHGRVSMFATMGYITPEVAGKLLGEIPPFLGVKFGAEFRA
ncbi:unnamed protein product [Prorocentrum cordatum]|uniref:Uncharacterized protein n=1 Tax=Prorocentrum cordatum TaxID=2364126 RepID=A0ABN9QYM6_9DINO|nr:unnamed protein product [Polarella glacialis]